MYRVWSFVTNYPLLLVLGAAIAVLWVNLDPSSYRHVVEYPLWFGNGIGHDLQTWLDAYGTGPAAREFGDVRRVVTPRFIVNDILMALFFAVVAKEVWEAAVLKKGSLRGRRAVTPVAAAFGGMAGAAATYLALAMLLTAETRAEVAGGWMVPTATDVAFAYLAARLVFGADHPALRFVLLLAIVDDIGGLALVAAFNPAGRSEPAWLLLSLGAATAVFLLFNWLPRRMDRGKQLRPASTFMRKRLSFWPYLLAGIASWYGFHRAGLQPALSLLPIVPAIPHADRAFGIFNAAERFLGDVSNHIQHLLKRPVEIVLFLFALCNAGAALAMPDAAGWLVLAAMVIGKPAGIVLFGTIAAHALGAGLPPGMTTRDLVVAGLVAATGFTVALFAATTAFAPGAALEGVRLGLLVPPAAAAILAIAVALVRTGHRRRERR